MNQTCATCKNWYPDNNESDSRQGQCRAEYPRLFLVGSQHGTQMITTWPATKRNEGCSKHEIKIKGIEQ